ncbi:MAG: ScpA family protein [Cyanobacteria bacterium P01_H01_bin.74]
MAYLNPQSTRQTRTTADPDIPKTQGTALLSEQKKHASSDEDGLGLLLQLAKRGEIDPWNIDIVQVADQYLQAVSEIRAADLKVTGKTLLYLAVLLRMKSDQLAGIHYLDPPDDEGFEPEAMLEPDFMDNYAIVQPKLRLRGLDEVIKRRTSTKQPRIRPVTLDDLLVEIQRYEALEKRRSLKEKVEKASNRRIADYADFTADDIEAMAHEEFHESSVALLADILHRLLTTQEAVSLDELVTVGQLDRISAFLALLFLSAGQSDFMLEQQAFYSEVYVRYDHSQKNQTG